MIWFTEQIQTTEQPPHIVMKVVGYYNPNIPTLPIIEIKLNIQNWIQNSDINYPLYNHNPHVPSHEDPNSEEIYLKYQSKIRSLITKIQNMGWNEVQNRYK